jgi:uncharacterized membrane protein YhiD involved in acid resistance
MNKKTIIITLLIILALIIFIAIKKDNKQNNQEITENNQEILVQTLEDGTKLNTSTKLLETKKVENLEISNSQLTNKEGKTILLADVKNVGNTTIQMIQLEITLVDSNQKEIEKLDGLLGTIKPGETVQLNIEATEDYSNIYDYIVNIKR